MTLKTVLSFLYITNDVREIMHAKSKSHKYDQANKFSMHARVYVVPRSRVAGVSRCLVARLVRVRMTDTPKRARSRGVGAPV